MAAARLEAVAAALKDDPDVGVGAAVLLLGGDFLKTLRLPPGEYESAVAVVTKAFELHEMQQRNMAQMIAAALAPYLR